MIKTSMASGLFLSCMYMHCTVVVLPVEWNGYILLYFWHCMFRVLNQNVKMLRPVNLEFL